MARIGNDVAGAAVVDLTVGHKVANKYLLALGAYVEKITVDVDGLGPHVGLLVAPCEIAAAIYADDAGSPGQRLAVTEAAPISHTGAGAGSARAWVDLPVVSISPTDEGLGVRLDDPGYYWIAVSLISGADQCVRLWIAGAGVGGAANDTGLVNPFGTFTVPNQIMAAYATVEFDAPPEPPPPPPPTTGLSLFRDAVQDELGDVAEMLEDDSLLRWINRGRRVLGVYLPTTATLTWAAGASSVALPANFGRFEEVISDPGSAFPQFVQLGTSLRFVNPTSVLAGTATLYYGSRYPDLDFDDLSTMPPAADEAVVSFILARFFSRLASSRSDFKRYAAITGQSGLEVTDFLDLSQQHDQDFRLRREELLAEGPASFYSD